MLIENAMERFSEFDTRQWAEWIENEISGINNSIRLPLSDLEIDEKLIIIFKEFKDNPVARNNLIKACVALLSQFSQTRTNLKGIFFLLQFIGYTRSEMFSNQLEIILNRELLKGMFYKEANLHHILLNELVNFSSIDNLRGYLYEKVTRNDDPVIKLIGLKYFYRIENSKNYFEYLEELISSEKLADPKIKRGISEEIVESFSEFGFYTKKYCELYKWVQDFWPKMENSFSGFRDFLNDAILNWLHNENALIKNEKNECIIGIKKFITAEALENEPEIDVFLDFNNIESYTFHEYKNKVQDLPPIERALKVFEKTVLDNNEYTDSEKYNKFFLMTSQYNMCTVLDPLKLRDTVEEFNIEIGNLN